MAARPKSIQEKVLNRTDRSGECWLFTGKITRDGYGESWHEGRSQRAHRLAYIGSFGPIAADMLVLHRCDVRRCVRPDHLFLGSPQDNMDDMKAKGRQRWRRGADHAQAKLSEQDAHAVRADYSMSARQWAERLGVTKKTVEAIRQRRRWSHV